ncbi:MAG: tetraacyldisaccharide 4'-kinase [Porticoccaceae bacterium]|nr:tetraacyldisaccharide 4'-kinase [Porticoccaceae bacterium]
MTEPRRATLEQTIVNAWYAGRLWLLLLLPLSLLFRAIVSLRRFVLQSLYQGRPFSAPVAIVGNISVGGSGKTPLIIALVRALAAKGYSVAVISRGYGGSAMSYPLEVQLDTAVEYCGDEPLLIKHKLADVDCAVVVDPQRKRAVEYALERCDCDLVLCDDGLQHYRLHRDIEIAVVDGSRGFGNKLCLPAGPLREPVSRLKSADFVVVNGDHRLGTSITIDANFYIKPILFRNLGTGQVIEAHKWSESKIVHAVAAIGNPQRFADTLQTLGMNVILLGFDDHKSMALSDLCFEDDYPVIITAKDAVKFTENDLNHVWVLEVDADIPPEFVANVLAVVGLS